MRFAVHRPGIPDASPRSHGVPRRGNAVARMVIAANLTIALCPDNPKEAKRRFVPGLKAVLFTPRL